MENFKKGLLPIRNEEHLPKSISPQGKKDSKEKSIVPYASIVGSLMHAMSCTRLDIGYIVSIMS